MRHTGTAVALTAALGFLLLNPPAEGAPGAPLAPRVKGVVLSRSECVLVVDQIALPAAGQSRTVRVLVSPRTRIAGRRTDAAAIRADDLIRADGLAVPDGSLEALHIEVILTANEVAIGRPSQAGFGGLLWEWIRHGSLTIPLP
jgi:hypothetical protein